MNGMFERFGHTIRKWVARSIETPRLYVKSAWVATLSVAETLLELVDSKLLPDINRIKEANIQSIEAKNRQNQAEADIKEAEAQLKLTEAVDAANRAAIHRRQDAIARAEKARLTAEAAKTEAEADAVRIDAESRRIASIGEAKARLLEAVSRLRQEGGELFVNPDRLESMLKLESPKQESDVSET